MQKKGFTILELMVAMTVFSFIAVMATGIVIVTVNNTSKVQNSISSVAELRFALESISRELRVGKAIVCADDRSSFATSDCDAGDNAKKISFMSSENTLMAYWIDGDTLKRCGSPVRHCGASPTDVWGAPSNPPPAQAVAAVAVAGNFTDGNLIGRDPLTLGYIMRIDPTSKFVVKGTDESGQPEQPKVTIFVAGTAGKGTENDRSFRLQTTISQRLLDL